jgi:hypothetical protein
MHAELIWFDEAFMNELAMAIDFSKILFLATFFLYEEPEALTYEIFM